MTYDTNMGSKLSKLSRKSSIAVIALVVTALALTLTTAALLSTNQTVPLNGTIGSGTTDNGTIDTINVGVYSDSACTQTATALNVGTLNPGGTATQTIYIKNAGNTAETLTMTTNNWTPTNAHLPDSFMEPAKHSFRCRIINPSNINVNSSSEYG